MQSLRFILAVAELLLSPLVLLYLQSVPKAMQLRTDTIARGGVVR